MIVVTTLNPPTAVRQTDHANMASRVAQWWPLQRIPGLEDPTVRGLFIEAIRHHDDGWYTWEASPARDDASGLPIDFKSIPTVDHVDIWKRSVESCAERHPYVGLLVTKHALSLYLRTSSSEVAQQFAARSLHDGGDDEGDATHVAELANLTHTPAPASPKVASQHSGYEHDVMVADAMAWLTEQALDLQSKLRDFGDGWTRVLQQIDEHRRVFTVFDSFTLMMLEGVPRQDTIRMEAEYALEWVDNERRVRLAPWPLNTFQPHLLAVETIDGHTIEWSLEPAGHAETAQPVPRPVKA